MSEPDSREKIPQINNIRNYGLAVAIAWTLVVACSLGWGYLQHTNEAALLGKMQGLAFFEKDILYRTWASRHGGVYAPVSKTTRPNPYLSHVPERDITTPSGRQLTLINPAYMTRQVFEMADERQTLGRGHITSLNPIRPENAPDQWERETLKKFEQGIKELGQIVVIDGVSYYRYMKPFIVEESCLKCHAAQGYKVGDVRGGLSVSLSMAPVYAMMAQEMRGAYIIHTIIWLIGIGAIAFGTRKLARMTVSLHEKNLLLEDEITKSRMIQDSLEEQTVALEEEIAERSHVEESLRSSEAKFSKAFEKAPIIMMISRIEDGICLDVNSKFTELFGFSREEMVGKTYYELCWITLEQQRQLTEDLLYRNPVSGTELQLKSKDGKDVTCVCYGEVISVDGTPCLLLLAHDVTEHRIIEGQLRQSQKMEAVGQLAGGVAHDFNNILTVIMGYCSLLQMDETLNQHQHDEVEQIVAASDKAAQLTRGLLMFSRKETAELQKVDLTTIIQQVQKFLVRIIGEDIQLKIITCCEKLLANVDTGQIEQVLINLATNARDAMPKGGMLTIETSLLAIDETHETLEGAIPSGRYACISVSDSGLGMDEETCKRIFEPFFTTKEIGKGTGLGMAIVYGVIKQHHGFINVYSELNIGTTFRIYLPLFGEEHQVHGESSLPDAPVGGDETLLIAEDEADVRNILNNFLTKHGYTIIQAADGQEAVEKFAAHHSSISLVIMDMIMPRKNGQEALQEILNIQPETKVLYVSGYTADFIHNRGINSENVEVITKPFQPLELLRKVRTVLDG